MTREEIKKAMRDTKREIVIKNLHKLLSLVEGYPEYEDCISYAVEKLEQEPILDKIRDEIKDIAFDWQEIDGEHESFMVVDLNDALNIIDKYKAEK